MANWKIYFNDQAPLVDPSANAESAAYPATNLITPSPKSLYKRGTIGTVTLTWSFGSSKTINGIAVANHSLTGETITLTVGSQVTTGTVPAGNFLWTGTERSGTTAVVTTSSLSATQYIGGITFLTGDVAEFDDGWPAYPIAQRRNHDIVQTRSIGADPIREVRGGKWLEIDLLVKCAATASSGDPGYDFRTYYDLYGDKPVWITPHWYASGSPAYKGYLDPVVGDNIAYPNDRTNLIVKFREIPQ